MNKDRIFAVDVLRGIAVLAVLLNHIPHYAMGGFRENPWFFPAFLMDFGYLGVGLFVVVSGFCIHRRNAIADQSDRGQRINWYEFWQRRMWRLYPPFVAAMILSLVLAAFCHDRYEPARMEFAVDAILHVLLLHNLTSAYAGGLGNPPFWSLGMEEQLYLLYAILAILFTRHKSLTAVFLAAIATILWRLGTVCLSVSSELANGGSSGWFGSWSLWPFAYWLHWALGAYAVDAYYKQRALPPWTRSLTVCFLLVVIGFLTNRLTYDFLTKTSIGVYFTLPTESMPIQLMSSLGELCFGLAFFILLNAMLRQNDHLKSRAWLALAGAGKISYSLYLTHLPIIFSLEAYGLFTHSKLDWCLRLGVYSMITVSVAVCFYFLVEKYFLVNKSQNALALAKG